MVQAFDLKILHKYVLVGCCVLFGLSCEEVIEPDLPVSEPQLTIDAVLGFNPATNDGRIIGQVTLTITAPFLNAEVSPATNATVELIDESSGIVYPITENEPGVFREGFPRVQFNTDYTLRVTYNNEVYTATEQLVRTGSIESVIQGDGFLFDEEEETEVIIEFVDVVGERNYYLFAFGFENFLVTDDEFYQDSGLTFSFFYEDVEPGDLLTITMLGVNANFANFVDQTLTQAGENANGLFAVPTANIRGNFVNTTNQENFAFGYFSLSEFDVALLTVE